MIVHVVLAKFDTKTSKEQKDEAINKLKQLQNLIPGIMELHSGYNFSNRGKGFELCLTIKFEDKQDLKVYGPHEAHLEVVKYLSDIGLTDILVVDFEPV